MESSNKTDGKRGKKQGVYGRFFKNLLMADYIMTEYGGSSGGKVIEGVQETQINPPPLPDLEALTPKDRTNSVDFPTLVDLDIKKQTLLQKLLYKLQHILKYLQRLGQRINFTVHTLSTRKSLRTFQTWELLSCFFSENDISPFENVPRIKKL